MILQALKQAEDHLLLVTQERLVYKKEVDDSRQAVSKYFCEEGVFVPPPPNGVIAHASNNIAVHYAFDFAQ